MDKGLPEIHQPVMADDVVRYLLTSSQGLYVDGTVGGGGHSEAICRKLGPGGRLIGLDQDPQALRTAGLRLQAYQEKIRLVQANFSNLDLVLAEAGSEQVQGVLLDLGMSSMQLTQSGRGFSFLLDEPLDMRMDSKGPVKAGDLVNALSAKELAGLFKKYGEEKKAGLIARAIVRQRQKKPLASARELAQLVRAVTPGRGRGENKHPATRIFQALRIAVNRELEHLQWFLEKIPAQITKGGRLVILSYHSLEDRLVKTTFQTWEKGCDCPPDLPHCGCGKSPLFRRVMRKGIRPSAGEIRDNPKARSAILRVAERM